MTVRKMPEAQAKSNSRPKATHYGMIEIAPGIKTECAVLQDGRRGFIQRQMVQAIGFTDKTRSVRFDRFCEKIGLNHLSSNNNSEWPVFEIDLPHGGVAMWTPYEVLPEIVKAGMVAFGQGKLTKQQEHIGMRCMQIGSALIGIGLVSLIDEATGYQYHREPDALQDLYSRIIREQCSDWERRFHPEYYRALCRLFGIPYGNQHRALPPIIGKITQDWVYEVAFPAEILLEIKSRKKTEKTHQWLKSDGIRVLEKQRDAVIAIARSSVDYRDFEARCSNAFARPGAQVKMMFPERGEAA